MGHNIIWQKWEDIKLTEQEEIKKQHPNLFAYEMYLWNKQEDRWVYEGFWDLAGSITKSE